LVFRLFLREILAYLNGIYRELIPLLPNALPNAIHWGDVEYYLSQKQFKDKVRLHLSFIYPKNGFRVEKLLRQTVFVKLYSRVKKYPNHPLRADPAKVAAMLVQYRKGTAQLEKAVPGRREQLRKALEAEDLELRDDSRFCKDWIHMNTLAEIEEVYTTG
jgi:hypothetical protein